MTDIDNVDVDLAKKAKEAYLDSKMEQIRQKNEALQKRHLEIEADKKDAEVNSNAALARQLSQETTSEKPIRVPKSSGQRRKPKYSEQQELHSERHEQKQHFRQGVYERKLPPQNDVTSQRRQQRLSEDDNPPPDPVYNFLHDKFRVGKESEDRQQQSRRHPSNYGGQDFANVKSSMEIRKRHEREHPRGPPRSKMEMMMRMTGHERTEYEEWKKVRQKCDQERIARQMTPAGEWRREWDRDKVVQDDDEEPWQKPSGFRGRGRGNVVGRGQRGRGNQGSDVNNLPMRSRGRGNRYVPPRKSSSGDSGPETEHVFPLENNTEVDPMDRRVKVQKHSLRVSVRNEIAKNGAQPNVSSNAQNVPVTSPIAGGSWTSSQSEDEIRFGENFSRRGKPPFRGRYEEQSPKLPSQPKESPNHVGSMAPVVAPKEQRLPRESEMTVTKVSEIISLGRESPKDNDLEEKEFIDESGGDSWEDVTTSGNNSQELSCPNEDTGDHESDGYAAENDDDDADDQLKILPEVTASSSKEDSSLKTEPASVNDVAISEQEVCNTSTEMLVVPPSLPIEQSGLSEEEDSTGKTIFSKQQAEMSIAVLVPEHVEEPTKISAVVEEISRTTKLVEETNKAPEELMEESAKALELIDDPAKVPELPSVSTEEEAKSSLLSNECDSLMAEGEGAQANSEVSTVSIGKSECPNNEDSIDGVDKKSKADDVINQNLDNRELLVEESLAEPVGDSSTPDEERRSEELMIHEISRYDDDKKESADDEVKDVTTPLKNEKETNVIMSEDGMEK